MITSILEFFNLLLGSLTAGTLLGVWLGFNPRSLSSRAYVEQQQNLARALDAGLPAMGAIVIVLTLVLLLLAVPSPAASYLYTAAVFCFVIAGVITRFGNQKINLAVMTWNPGDPPPDWTAYRDRWWRWHTLRTIAGALGLICLISAVLLAGL